MNNDNPVPEAPRRRRGERRRRRRFIIILGAAILLGLLVSARPIYRGLKAKRAEHIAEEADRLVAAGKWNEAAGKYSAALQLDPLGYKPLSGAARLASKGNRPEAIDLWRELIKLPRHTTRDRQDYADFLLHRGEVKLAEPILAQLVESRPDTNTLRLATRFFRAKGNREKALEFARAAVVQSGGEESAKFELAELLAISSEPGEQTEARQILWELAEKGKAAQSSAIDALVRAPNLQGEERQKLLRLLEKKPQTTATDAIARAQLRLALQPEEASQIFEELTQRLQQDAKGLLPLTRFLNLHLQSDRVLALVSEGQALENNELLVSRLDALAAQQRWPEINTLLGRPDLRLEPAYAAAFRGHAAQIRKASTEANSHWRKALALAENNPGTLRFVARLAERSKADEIALAAYEQLGRSPEHVAFAFRSSEHLLLERGDTSAMRAFAEKVATQHPDDPNARSQHSYLNLLLGIEVEKHAAEAAQLAKSDPSRLAYRVTAALGYLRQHNSGAALAQFHGPAIDWQKTPPSWRAVYAATMIANEEWERARGMLPLLPLDKLKPEERELIRPILSAPPPTS